MGVYEGKRTIDGLVVTVDGKKLDEHYEIKRFTRFGFEWSYEGDSPQQLALAILFDRLGDKERAIKLCEPFMKTVVANLDNDWKLTGEEIDGFVRAHPRGAAAARARRADHHSAAQGHSGFRHQSAQPAARAGSAPRAGATVESDRGRAGNARAACTAARGRPRHGSSCQAQRRHRLHAS